MHFFPFQRRRTANMGRHKDGKQHRRPLPTKSPPPVLVPPRPPSAAAFCRVLSLSNVGPLKKNVALQPHHCWEISRAPDRALPKEEQCHWSEREGSVALAHWWRSGGGRGDLRKVSGRSGDVINSNACQLPRKQKWRGSFSRILLKHLGRAAVTQQAERATGEAATCCVFFRKPFRSQPSVT